MSVRMATATWAAAIAVAMTVQTARAVDVKVDTDKAFDFTRVRTWAWNPKGAGDVKMARSQDDDPEAVRRQVEPTIVALVETELQRRGLQPATGTPDLVATYFLLLSTNFSEQTLGQFLPGMTEWGLPPFSRPTQSLQLMNRGSLVLDFSSGGAVVWRGVADAKIKVDADPERREALLQEAVRDLIRRFPRRP